MKKILITGGPVHAYLDDVKIITNKFNGGLIALLANELAYKPETKITYLTSQGSRRPLNENIKLVLHDGFEDYRNKCQEMASSFDIVILGAAVANLIPVKPIVGKFPSHNYKPGDVIPIDFCIAPRIVDTIKKAAPNVNLFAFKLLSGVPHEELIDAAHEIAIESKAMAVIANDYKNLKTKYIVGKERSDFEIQSENLADVILKLSSAKFYHTDRLCGLDEDLPKCQEFRNLVNKLYDNGDFTETKSGFVFGTVAVRQNKGFLTTSRGKKEVSDIAYVMNVKHDEKIVCIHSNKGVKATLNAPLLDFIFKKNPNVFKIIHNHNRQSKLPIEPYFQPGTDLDSLRNISTSFYIDGHGEFLLFNKEGEQI